LPSVPVKNGGMVEVSTG